MSRVREFVEADYRYHDELTWYPGTIVNVEDDDFGYGPTVVFVIELDDDPLDDELNRRQIKAMASDKLTPNSKLTKWVKGIFGSEVLEQGAIDLDLATNTRVEVMFEHGENSEGSPNEKITQIKASRS